MYVIAALLIGAFFLSLIVTNLVKGYTIRKQMFDVPNERSSHTDITPRGGGLGFVVVSLIFVGVLAVYKYIPPTVAIGLCGGGAIVAVTGWIDDINELPVRIRVILHLVAALWVLFWLGGLTHVDSGSIIPIFNNWWVRNLLAFFGIVWMINLYNFMDGVDGLAGIEAISVSVFAGGLLLLKGSTGMALLCLVLVLSVGGFLVWNWPPAKIFMGDVGSGFLGLVFATIAIASENLYPVPLFVWLLLLGVFVVDATATLIWRVGQGEKWYKAHRTHVYQLAVQAGYTHKQVTLTVLGINIVLALIAYITVFLHLILWGIAIGAALVLLFIQIKLRNLFDKKIKELDHSNSLERAL